MEQFDKKTTQVCLALAGITFLVFQSVTSFGFVNYDDPLYVTQNPAVLAGLTWRGIVWAFTQIHASNWHPVTWLSHMTDVELFGLDAGWHHITNLVFHIANSLLLFLLLKKITAAFWRSAFVAALFALHPLHIESVAWISERKDVLSMFFFLLTIWFYARFVEFKVQTSSFKVQSYCLALFFFALGLMSKPMLVTTPFVLLLLDYWPLNRFELKTKNSKLKTFQSLLPEKIPFFALSFASVLVTFAAQSRTISGFESLPLPIRLCNASFSYLRYFKKTLWPSKLAVFYPYPDGLSFWLLLAAAIFLVGVTALAILNVRKKPWLAFGWFWFLGTLVPVIGLVQAGLQSSADRYTYIPMIGLGIIFAWGCFDLTQNFPWQRTALAIFGGASLASCAVVSYFQLQYWHDSKVLFEHAIAVTSRNAIAHYNLGISFLEQNDMATAKKHFVEAEKFKPQYPEIQNNLANILSIEGDLDGAVVHFETALRFAPGHAAAHINLGSTLAQLGKPSDAIPHFRTALKFRPELAVARRELALALCDTGALADALKEITEFVRQNPNDAEGHVAFGKIISQRGDSTGAGEQFATALQLNPNLVADYRRSAQTSLAAGKFFDAVRPLEYALLFDPQNMELRGQFAEALSFARRPAQAQTHFESLLKVKPTDARAHYYLGLVLVMQSKSKEAIPSFRQAILLETNWTAPKNDLSWLLATDPNPENRNGGEAVKLAQQACDLSKNAEPQFIGTLDAALAEAGQFEKAIETAEKARELFITRGQDNFAKSAAQRIELYRQKKPFHQSPTR